MIKKANLFFIMIIATLLLAVMLQGCAKKASPNDPLRNTQRNSLFDQNRFSTQPIICGAQDQCAQKGSCPDPNLFTSTIESGCPQPPQPTACQCSQGTLCTLDNQRITDEGYFENQWRCKRI